MSGIDHDYIYLQPPCCADEEVGRLWCEDPDPEDCEDGKHWTRYVRADIHEAAIAEAEQLLARVAELEAICENVPEGCTPADARVLREANHRLTNDFFNTLQKLKAADDERESMLSRVAELEAQAQAVEDSEICAMAELMMIHDRFMRGVLTKEIMIDAVNRVGKESIAKIKADAVREALNHLESIDISSFNDRAAMGFCKCMSYLDDHIDQLEADNG